MNKETREKMRESLREIIRVTEANKMTQLSFSVEYDLWHKFKACCYFQNIDPHDALTNYMKASSPESVLEFAKKFAGGKE